jgi:hypothetical protein
VKPHLRVAFALNDSEKAFKHSPGGVVDVMIAIFCDFRQFSAEKMAFFSKKQCYDQSVSKTSSNWRKKRQFLLNFFNCNIGPCLLTGAMGREIESGHDVR